MDLNFESRGSGHPLIILHGLFGSLDNWRTMSRRLSDRFQVFSLDLRNHGGSPHTAEFSCGLMAQDLGDFMHSHGIPEAHVLGHSMGGKVAMHYAVACPEKVSKLVVVDMAPKAYRPAHDEIFRVLSTIPLDNFSTRNEVRLELDKQMPDKPVAEFLLKNLVTSETGRLQWKMNLASLGENYRDIIAAPQWEGVFDKPALFLKGGDSDYLLPEDHVVIRKFFPRAHIATIPSVGHWVHAEAPDSFETQVRDFLFRTPA